MTRTDFLRLCGAVGGTMSIQSILNSCESSTESQATFEGSVLIIGAGAAGLTAGYLLAQRGIDFQIVEASSTYGGRTRQTTTFSDFPIPLGAEWLHVNESILMDAVNDPSIQITTRTQEYALNDSIGYVENGVLSIDTIEQVWGGESDQKFIGSTWFGFLEEYILPSVRDKITFDTQIVSVDFQGGSVIITDVNSQTFTADKVIVSVPLKILQDRDITFTPSLPERKIEVLNDAEVWGGMKVFLEFTESFYPTFLVFPDSDTDAGQRLYYDAAYGQQTSSHVLGLFAVGAQAEPYQTRTGNDLRDYILQELDAIFDGAPSRSFVKHIAQNWNEEPFIRAAYLADEAPSRISRILSESIDDKVYFAGDAYTQEDDWSSVHTALRSAIDAVDELIR